MVDGIWKMFNGCLVVLMMMMITMMTIMDVRIKSPSHKVNNETLSGMCALLVRRLIAERLGRKHPLLECLQIDGCCVA